MSTEEKRRNKCQMLAFAMPCTHISPQSTHPMSRCQSPPTALGSVGMLPTVVTLQGVPMQLDSSVCTTGGRTKGSIVDDKDCKGPSRRSRCFKSNRPSAVVRMRRWSCVVRSLFSFKQRGEIQVCVRFRLQTSSVIVKCHR